MKASVVVGDAAAQHDGEGAAVKHRAADEKAEVGPIAMELEKLLVAAIFPPRIERRGVDRQPSRGIEHLQRAEVFCRGGTVEQQQMQDRFAEVLDFRQVREFMLLAAARSDRS